jgi:hypothetical protein
MSGAENWRRLKRYSHPSAHSPRKEITTRARPEHFHPTPASSRRSIATHPDSNRSSEGSIRGPRERSSGALERKCGHAQSDGARHGDSGDRYGEPFGCRVSSHTSNDCFVFYGTNRDNRARDAFESTGLSFGTGRDYVSPRMRAQPQWSIMPCSMPHSAMRMASSELFGSPVMPDIRSHSDQS